MYQNIKLLPHNGDNCANVEAHFSVFEEGLIL